MKNIKRMGLLALILALGMSLTACGGKSGLSKDEAMTYVTGIIEENYLGTASDEFKKLVDIDDDDVASTYEGSMDAEVEYFIYNYAIEYPTDEQQEEIKELYKEIYSHLKFEVVSAAEQDDGSFSVKVTIYPIDIAHLAEEELETALEPWYEKYPTEVQENMSEEEKMTADAEWARIIVDAFQSKLPEIGNLDAQSTTVQLEKDEDGYYSITDEDFYRMDAMVIDYPYYEG